MHNRNQYLDFGIKGFCIDPHNLDVILLKHLGETAAQWMSKHSEKAVKTRGKNLIGHQISTKQL